MQPREIIGQTMKNADLLYQDVGETIGIAENRMKASGFSPLGDAACTWEVSTAYYNPRQ